MARYCEATSSRGCSPRFFHRKVPLARTSPRRAKDRRGGRPFAIIGPRFDSPESNRSTQSAVWNFSFPGRSLHGRTEGANDEDVRETSSSRAHLLIVANDCKLLRNGTLMEIARFNGRRVNISASNSVINVINVEIATSLSRRWIRGNVTVGFG